MNTQRTRSRPRWASLLAALGLALGLGLSALACEPFADPQDFDREEVLVFKRSEFFTKCHKTWHFSFS